MSLPIQKQVLHQQLETEGVHPQALEDTSPATANLTIYEDDEGRAAGIWECTPGTYRIERTSDELCIILDGRWQLTGDDGDEYDLKAGDVIYLRKGWHGTSKVIETLRKVYMAA